MVGFIIWIGYLVPMCQKNSLEVNQMIQLKISCLIPGLLHDAGNREVHDLQTVDRREVDQGDLPGAPEVLRTHRRGGRLVQTTQG